MKIILFDSTSPPDIIKKDQYKMYEMSLICTIVLSQASELGCTRQTLPQTN